MTEPPKKKNKPTQSDICGLTQRDIDWYQSRPPADKWYEFIKLKVLFTYITKKWMYKENSLSQKFLVPNGMTKTLMQIWEKTKCYHSFDVIPVEVREKLNIEESTFDSKKMKLELTTTGKMDIGEFWYGFCKICQKTVDGLIQKHKDKLPTGAKS